MILIIGIKKCPRKFTRNVHENSPKKCPQKFTQKCPRKFAFYVHEKSATHLSNKNSFFYWFLGSLFRCSFIFNVKWKSLRPNYKILQWRTFQKFDQLCEKVSESGNQERCCQTDRQTSTRRSIIWGEPLHFAGLRESMKSYFWIRLNSKSKWKKDTKCVLS